MLGDKTSMAVVAVKDIATAQKFYEETLGLTKSETQADPGGGVMYKTGSSMLLVYPSQYAGTNQATAVGWGCGDDLDKIIADLKGKGVNFEHYDNLPGAKLNGDVHEMGKLRAAWFKDPDGNILNLVNQM